MNTIVSTQFICHYKLIFDCNTIMVLEHSTQNETKKIHI